MGKSIILSMNKSDLTLLLVSYDGYGDMWPAFFECKERFWPDCPYPLVLSNNEKAFEARNVRVINCGKEAQWSTRTRIALESIESKYVLFLLEDLFISDRVKTSDLQNAIALMEENNLDYYKIMTFSKICTKNYKGMGYLHEIPASWPYGISLQAAIWNREYFLNLVGGGDYNPWVFEVRRLNDEKKAEDPNALVGVFDDRNIMNICHMVVQGKYLPKAVKFMQNKGVHVDLDSRSVMTWKENVTYILKLAVSEYTDKHPMIRKVIGLIGPKSVVNRNR